ncbi:MAG: PD-(D/E)XK nuclease family protein [Gammaproteobacteria bacterium]|nr:PD-(D/E)XK nuclease family protein [Gammaproteobacteria bacterium]
MENFSYSRLNTYNSCPRKHSYMYEEKIFTDGNEYLMLGDLFHQCLDKAYKGEDFSSVINDYEAKVKVGTLSTESGLLEDIVNKYLAYYDITSEELIGSELRLEEEWEDGDKFSGVIDRLVDVDGMIILRDTKTTLKPLKYTQNQVKYNTQLLTYCSMVQDHMNIIVDAYEIDEVRLAKLQPVPLNQNGKPTADKNRLGLVTYEDYYNKLCEMGLDEAPEYQGILDYMEKRGHPLFKRTRCQLLDQNILSSNIQDLYETYKGCKSGNKQRIRGPLCDYCPYQDLCNLDFYLPTPDDREIIINKIKKGA